MPPSLDSQLSSKHQISTKPRDAPKGSGSLASSSNSRSSSDYNPNYYTDAESLFAALEEGSVALLRSSWLIERAASGKRLERRQDLPAAAFMPVTELRRVHIKSKAVVAKGSPIEFKPVPIVAVSHFWRTREHPDPEMVTLGIVAAQLHSLLTTRFSSGSTCRELGLRDFGVFFDYGSLFQKPRSEAEDAAFASSLATMDIWYAHSLTTKIAVTDSPAGVVPYHERGWCTFEYQLMQLLLPSTYTSLWCHFIQYDGTPDDDDEPPRPTPAPPDAFFAGGRCAEKVFTNGADRELVAAKWAATVSHIMGHTTELLFQNAGWDDEEMAQLGAVLPLCTRLQSLMLRGNAMTALPPAIGALRTLERIGLQECDQLVALPDALAELPKLARVDCDGCTSLTTIPDVLRNKRGLSLVLPRHLR